MQLPRYRALIPTMRHCACLLRTGGRGRHDGARPICQSLPEDARRQPAAERRGGQKQQGEGGRRGLVSHRAAAARLLPVARRRSADLDACVYSSLYSRRLTLSVSRPPPFRSTAAQHAEVRPLPTVSRIVTYRLCDGLTLIVWLYGLSRGAFYHIFLIQHKNIY